MNLNEVDLWWYKARAIRVVDGDTVIFEIDKGMKDYSVESIRVNGINTAELFSGNEKELGGQAKAFTTQWIKEKSNATTQVWPFMIRTYKDKQTFNRYIGDVYSIVDESSLADSIIEAGFSEDLR